MIYHNIISVWNVPSLSLHLRSEPVMTQCRKNDTSRFVNLEWARTLEQRFLLYISRWLMQLECRLMSDKTISQFHPLTLRLEGYCHCPRPSSVRLIKPFWNLAPLCLGLVRSYVSQHIRYVLNWPKSDFNIFALIKSCSKLEPCHLIHLDISLCCVTSVTVF